MANKKQNVDFIPARVRERLQTNKVSMLKMINDLTKMYGTDTVPTYRTFQKCMQSGRINRETLEHIAQYLHCSVIYLIDMRIDIPLQYTKGTLFMQDSYSAFRQWLNVAELVIDPVDTFVKSGMTVSQGDTSLHVSLTEAEEAYKELFALLLELPADDEDISLADEYYAVGQLDGQLHAMCLDTIEQAIQKIYRDLRYLKNRKEEKNIIMEAIDNGNKEEEQ